jgi:hypothetical protein
LKYATLKTNKKIGALIAARNSRFFGEFRVFSG